MSDGWISRQIKKAKLELSSGPEWMRQAVAVDYSAKRQIKSGLEKNE